MKKYAFTLITFIFMLIAFSSCLPDENCKDCYIVTYSPDGEVENKTFAGEFCDEDLEYYEGKESTDPSGVKTVYECE